MLLRRSFPLAGSAALFSACGLATSGLENVNSLSPERTDASSPRMASDASPGDDEDGQTSGAGDQPATQVGPPSADGGRPLRPGAGAGGGTSERDGGDDATPLADPGDASSGAGPHDRLPRQSKLPGRRGVLRAIPGQRFDPRLRRRRRGPDLVPAVLRARDRPRLRLQRQLRRRRGLLQAARDQRARLLRGGLLARVSSGAVRRRGRSVRMLTASCTQGDPCLSRRPLSRSADRSSGPCES